MKEVTYEEWIKNPKPRIMWVWHNDFEEREKGKVVYVIKDDFAACPVLAVSEEDASFCLYCHCAEIEEPEEKKPRPYSNPDEMIEDFKKRYNSYGGWSGKENPMYSPLIWIKSKDTGFRHLVTDYGDNDNCGHCNKICIWIGTLPINFKELYENYTYLDGTPCGITEE